MDKLTIQALIDNNIASGSDVNASELREVLTAMLNYNDFSFRASTVEIDPLTVNASHTVATGLPSNALILSVTPFLQCKFANNNYAVGDKITAPTPYPRDVSRTAEQGLGIQWTSYVNIRVMTGDEISIMRGWVNAGSGDVVNASPLTNWKLVLVIIYTLQ